MAEKSLLGLIRSDFDGALVKIIESPWISMGYLQDHLQVHQVHGSLTGLNYEQL